MTELLSPPKILCVDHDPEIIRCYSEFLAESGYDVYLAASPTEGLNLSIKHVPDLIITEAFMPCTNGNSFFECLKKEPVLDTTAIFLVYLEDGDIADEKAMADRANDNIFKPLKKNELLSKVQVHLQVKSLQEKLGASELKFRKALRYSKKLKQTLDEKNKNFLREKEMLDNSLRQISLMVEERDALKSRLDEINRLYKENFDRSIDLLSSIIESKRQFHRGHAKKVADISVFIAREFGLDEKEIRDIEMAARLHEIGKLSIPDALALKSPDEYTTVEKDLLLYHPVKGAELLKDFVGFGEILNIIRHLHERVDGKGVPRGLKKKQIPLGSRIIAVANTFENIALREKGGLVENALAVLEEGIGLRFDSQVIHRLRKYLNAHPVNESERTNEVGIFNLEPGMVLSAPIYTSKGTKLLPADMTLTKSSIEQVARYSKIDSLDETVFIKE